MSNEMFSTPLHDDIIPSEPLLESFNPLTYQGECDSIVKTSLHVFLAAMLGQTIPLNFVLNVFSRIPQLASISNNIVRGLIIVIFYIIINKFVGFLF